MKAKTVVISINASWNVVNFRAGLVRALRGAGYRIVALTPSDAYSARLEAIGAEHVPIAMDSQSVSPIKDLMLLARYYRALRAIRPDLYLGYTAKPNIYGSLAAHALGIKVINNISGLGTSFIRQNWLTPVVSSLYRLALRRSATIFFQNGEDLALFRDKGLVRGDRARTLPGSGIDLDRFAPGAPACDRDVFRFILVARLLRDKGVCEYVEAARQVRREAPHARFGLLGFLDVANPTAIGRAEVEGWVREGVIDYLGEAEDVRPFIASADALVLPSYREGLSRTLLEGAAMAKPLIATDVPGCRDVVTDGVNGFLCAPRDAASLAGAMLKLLNLPSARRLEMGAASRALVEENFAERIVVERYLEAVREALSPAA